MGVNLLLSYAFHGGGLHAVRRGIDLGEVRARMACGRILIDSGAFTAHTIGPAETAHITLDRYAAWLDQWAGVWDHAVTLDVIGDPAATAANTRRLHAQGLPVMPVFTAGSRLEELDAMVADCGYVAVGGLVGRGVKTETLVARLRMLQRRAADAGGGIHALGVGALSVLRRARPYSADVSSASGRLRFGTLAYFDGVGVRGVGVGDLATDGRARAALSGAGVDVAALLRSRRIPGKAGRPDLVRAMALAYACADESLRRTSTVAAPKQARGDGPHMYSAMNRGGGPVAMEALTLADLDAALHAPGAGDRWPVWRPYAGRHECTSAAA